MDGHILVGVGLGLNVIATLFLSLDALESQRDSALLIAVQAHMLGIDRGSEKQKQEAMRRTPAEKLAGGLPLEGAGMTIAEAEELMNDATTIAQGNNRDIALGIMNKLTDRFDRRLPFIKLAIGTVLAGGVLELIGAVFFTA